MGCCDHLGRAIRLFQGWHRPYMVNFELGLLGQGTNVGLPYWDWTDGPDTEILQVPQLAEQGPWLSGIKKTDNMPTTR